MPHRVYQLFFKLGEVVEIRGLGLAGKSKAWADYARKNDVVSGYFDNADDFAFAAMALDKAGARGVYFSLNPCMPVLHARAKNRLVACPKATTTDANVKCLRWLPIDLDPARPSEISSNDSEVKAAEGVGREITAWFEGELGFAKGIRGFSGNGYHILYRLPDLANNDENRSKVRNALRAIEAKFRNDRVLIDLSVTNPARIWKLYGTTGH